MVHSTYMATAAHQTWDKAGLLLHLCPPCSHLWRGDMDNAGLQHQETRSISHMLSTSDLTHSMVWSCFKCWNHCTYSASTHHRYHCTSSPGPVRSCGSCEQWYSCALDCALCLSPSHRNLPYRWLEEITWSPRRVWVQQIVALCPLFGAPYIMP